MSDDDQTPEPLVLAQGAAPTPAGARLLDDDDLTLLAAKKAAKKEAKAPKKPAAPWKGGY